jgi:cyclophilin family peptidyl-prolyl cis-trans isomerase
LPRFEWRAAPIGDKPRATIQTAVGDFDVELDARGAPEATAVFLQVALAGGYHSGRFHTAVRDPKEPKNGLVSASASPLWVERAAPRLKLDDVPATKARPADGTIALVRGGTAPGAFVVFVGTPPEPFGDMVPFGRVVKGAEVVRKLLAEPDGGDKAKSAIDIRRVIRTE